MTLSVHLTVSNNERSGAQGCEGGEEKIGKGQIKGRNLTALYLPLVLARNIDKTTVAPAACIAAMKAADDCPVV